MSQFVDYNFVHALIISYKLTSFLYSPYFVPRRAHFSIISVSSRNSVDNALHTHSQIQSSLSISRLLLRHSQVTCPSSLNCDRQPLRHCVYLANLLWSPLSGPNTSLTKKYDLLLKHIIIYSWILRALNWLLLILGLRFFTGHLQYTKRTVLCSPLSRG